MKQSQLALLKIFKLLIIILIIKNIDKAINQSVMKQSMKNKGNNFNRSNNPVSDDEEIDSVTRASSSTILSISDVSLMLRCDTQW